MQVKDLAKQQGQEASPAFLQAYALNAVSIFATQAAEESYSGEDLEGEEGDYYTSSSVERPYSNSSQRLTQEEDRNRNLVSKKRHQQSSGGGGGVDGTSEIDKEIAVIERSASAMVLHSPTTRSNATPSTTQNNNRSPTVSGIPSENINSSSCVDQDVSDTAGMFNAVGVGGQVQGTPSRPLLGGVREGREAEGERQQLEHLQEQRQQRNGQADDGEVVLLPPQTPGEPSRPGNDEPSDDEDDEEDNDDIDREGNVGDGQLLGDDEEEDQEAALVREMSILEAADAGYDTGIDNEDQEEHFGTVRQAVLQEEEQESPPSRDENENRFFGAATAAAGAGGGNGDLLGQSNIEGAFPGGVLPQEYHQAGHVSFPSAAALAGQHQASPIAVPQRAQAAAGHREKRDPRPSSSGGPSRLSNDPPKRQRKGPGFIVGSAPHDGGGGGGGGGLDGEPLLQAPPSLPVVAVPNNLIAAMGGLSGLPQASPLGAAAGPLGNSDGSAVSRGSVGGAGVKQAKSSGKLYRKEPEGEEEVNDGRGDGEDRNKKKKSGNQQGIDIDNNPGAPTGGRGKKRDAPVVVREGGSLSISLETVPVAEFGGVQGRRGAWGSSLVCADLTVHEVASQYWPFLKKATTKLATGEKSAASCGAAGSKEGAYRDTSSDGMSEGVQRELSFDEKNKVHELTADLEAAILGALSDEGPKPVGGRRLNAKVKSLAVVAAFDELWKEREKRLQEEENQKEEEEVAGAEGINI